MSFEKKVLFLTVGSHDVDLYKNSIRESKAHLVILFSSQSSLTTAENIKKHYENEQIQIECYSLSDENDAWDVDKCYNFYDSVFQQIVEKGFEYKNFSIDFTYGTKAMAAALYAIGMRYRISVFLYSVKKSEEDNTQILKTFDASYARGLALLDQCKHLFKAGQFAAATNILNENAFPAKLESLKNGIIQLANFYTAWDRLDYKTAKECLTGMSDCSKLQQGFDEFCVPENVKQWVRDLANREIKKTPRPPKNEYPELLSLEEYKENSETVLRLVIDLHANALRRLKANQLEDAAVRAYRIYEMLGQSFLYREGYDTACIPDNDEKVKSFIDKHNKKHAPIVALCGNRYYQFDREKTAHFLKHLGQAGDGQELLEKAQNIAKLRNNGILIHGFRTLVKDQDDLKNQLDNLANLLEKFKKSIENADAANFINEFIR